MSKKTEGQCKKCLEIFPRSEFRVTKQGHLKERICKKCRIKHLQAKYNRHPWQRTNREIYRAFVSKACFRCGFSGEPCQMDVDHKDGDRTNNDPGNLQTLCANCHRLKSFAPVLFAIPIKIGAN